MKLARFTVLLGVFISFGVHCVSAAPPFDVDGDGQEGLPEAIHALQVNSGLAEAAVLAGNFLGTSSTDQHYPDICYVDILYLTIARNI